MVKYVKRTEQKERRRRCHIDRLWIGRCTGRKKASPLAETAEQQNIAVTGLGRSVGTTFIATSLAFYISEKGNSLTFVQCAAPGSCSHLLYDSAAMDKRFVNRKFIDVYQRIKDNQPVRGVRNMEEGINWILPTPENCDEGLELNGEEKGRLIQCARGQVCVFDVEAETSWNPFLAGMDLLIVVVDPLPSKLIRSSRRFRFLKELELSGCPVIWLVNRVNKGISRRQVIGYLKTQDLLWVGEFPAETVYSDEFSCRFHWENNDIKCQLMEIFTKVSQ